VPEDASAIASVLYESFAEYEPSYTPEAFAFTVSTTEKIQERMREGPVWVALDGEKITGTVGAVALGGSLYVRGMAVVPTARGNGTGRLLMEHVEEFAAGQGFKRMSLSTTPFLARAIRLYEQFGFRRSPEGPHDLFGTPLFTMVKNLWSSYEETFELNNDDKLWMHPLGGAHFWTLMGKIWRRTFMSYRMTFPFRLMMGPQTTFSEY
jgi:GNAT superfamily N-acetyltransferase